MYIVYKVVKVVHKDEIPGFPEGSLVSSHTRHRTFTIWYQPSVVVYPIYPIFVFAHPDHAHEFAIYNAERDLQVWKAESELSPTPQLFLANRWSNIPAFWVSPEHPSGIRIGRENHVEPIHIPAPKHTHTVPSLRLLERVLG